MKNKRRGWIGRNSQVKHYLKIVGADRDDQGRFLVSEPGVASFLGMAGDDVDVVISTDVKFYVRGHERGLASGLRSTSYGLGVYVI